MIERDYNTQRKKMKLPEYGRSIHKMLITSCRLKTGRSESWLFKGVIDVMGMMYPYLRISMNSSTNFGTILRSCLILSLISITRMTPQNRKHLSKSRKLIPYSQADIKFRHYGKIMENYITATAQLDDEIRQRR